MTASDIRSPYVAEAGTKLKRRRFDSLCAPFGADVLRYLLWLCRDRALAEDVMQETLLRAWRAFDSLEQADSLRPWLLTIARRELARVFERKRPEMVDIDSLTHLEGSSSGPEHEIVELRRAMLQLQPEYREPLVLQVLFGYSTEEIATHMQLSLPAVLTRLHRARHRLRAQLIGAAATGEQGEQDEL
jgi:RNA polymerase sigma-70 factor, ECF subfamily